MVEALFPSEKSQKPSVATQKQQSVSPIFGEENVPHVTPKNPPHQIELLFPAGESTPTTSVRRQQVEHKPDFLFANEPASVVTPIAQNASPKKPVAPSVAFAPERDPIVEAYLKKVMEAYPQESPHENLYRNLLAQVIPTTQEKTLVWGEHVVQVAQGAIARAQQVQAQWAQMNVQETLQATIEAAKVHQQLKLGTGEHGVAGLLHRAQALVESVEYGDPAEGKRALENLAAGIRQSLSSVSAITDLCQECADQLAQLGRCAQVLIPAIQDASLHGALERRSMVFLGLLQQAQIAQKQIQQQSSLLATELSQIDQAVHVTLPALGVF